MIKTLLSWKILLLVVTAASVASIDEDPGTAEPMTTAPTSDSPTTGSTNPPTTENTNLPTTESSDTPATTSATSTVTFNQSMYSVDENGGPAQPLLVLSSPSSTDISIKITVSSTDGSANGGVDYNSGPYTITFPAGVTSVSFDVPINDDNMFEGTENFTLTINTSSLSGDVTRGDPSSATVTIVDDDAITVRFNQLEYSINESHENITLSLVLSGKSSIAIDVMITTSNMNTTDDDYGSGPYHVTFSAGIMEVSFDVSITRDDTLETNEQFKLSIVSSLPDRVMASNPSQTTVTIIDDDDITVMFKESTYTVGESNGTISPVLVLSNPSSTDIVVNVQNRNVNTATGGDDFGVGPYSVKISAGEIKISFNVTIMDDTRLEKDEEFQLRIATSLPFRITRGTPSRTTVTITDDDSVTVMFEQSTYSVSEKNNQVFPVLVLSNPSSIDIMLKVQGKDVNNDTTATGGVDYRAGPYNVTFPAGMTRIQFDIPIIMDDNTLESNEQFHLCIVNSLPDRVSLGNPKQTTVTIRDDDAITVQFRQLEYSINESQRSVRIVVILSGESSTAIDVMIKTSNKNTNGDDYGSGPYDVTFSAGMTKKPFNVPITKDDKLETNEQFQLNIVNSLPDRVTLGDTSQTIVTIIDDDDITVKFEDSAYTVGESNGTISPVIILSNPSSTDIILQVQNRNVNNVNKDITATGDVDYKAGPYSITFPTGMTRTSFNVSIINDDTLEKNEQFQLSIRSNSLPDRVTDSNPKQTKVTILDDDAITIAFKQPMYSVTEGNRQVSIYLVVSNPSSTDIPMQIQNSDGTATGGKDYVAGPYPFTFSAGSTEALFTVIIMHDKTLENDEQFQLSIVDSLPERVTLGDPRQTTVIINDNDELTVKFSQNTYTSTESSKSIAVTLLLEGGTSDNDINVIVTPSDQSANGNGVDYTSITITATFTAGTTSTTINIPVTEDHIVEGNEAFDLSLDIPSTLQRVVMSDVIMVTCIIEDSTTYTISFDQPMYSVNEGGRQVSITLTHTNQSSIDIIAQIDSRHVHTGKNRDYVTGPYEITFPANQLNAILTISIEEDDIVEIDEMFNVTITSSVPVGMAPGRYDHTTVTIIDNDMTTVSFMTSTYTIRERKSSKVKPSIVLSNPSSIDFMILINSTDMTAAGGEDYMSGPYDIRISGKDPVEFTINIINDNIFEINEQFGLSIASISLPDKVSISKQNYQTIVTIRDDDDNRVEFGQSVYSVEESNRRVEPVLVFTNPSSTAITIVIRSIDNSATGEEDYGIGPYNVTLPHGETRVLFGVPISEDDIKEDAETFTLSIVSELLPSRVTVKKLNPVTIVINDTTGKPRVEFNQSDYFVSESSGSVIITLLLNGSVSTDEITVTVTPSAQSAGEQDYAVSSVTARFSAGANSTQVNINIKTDDIVEQVETFGLTLSIPLKASSGSITMATVHIMDSTMSKVSFSQSTYSVNENNGPVYLILVLTNPSSTDINVTVHLHNTDTNATVGSDFTTGPYHVTFPNMATSTSLAISIEDDNISEGNEVFRLVIVQHLLPNNINISLGSPGSATVAIMDTTVIAAITDHPNSTIVYVGKAVRLSCGATASGTITYQWRRSNGEITGDRFNGVNTPTLTIPSVTQDDEDEYYCTASYGVDLDGTPHVAKSERAKVVVFGPPTFQPFDEVHYVIIGHSFVLNCTATNDPDSPNNLHFRWFKDSDRKRNRIDEEDQWNITEHVVNTATVTSQLVISDLKVSQHNGVYICIVRNNNKASFIRQNTTVVVETPTNIITHPQSQVVFVNSTTTLSCEATGSVPISYQWRRVNKTISKRAIGVNTTLTISPVREEDEGEYYCVTTNGGVDEMRYNDTSQVALVTVFGPPIVQPLNATYYGITDNMFTLNCAATNDPQSPNNITFEWFKDGTKQNDSTGIKSKMLDVSTSQLVIDEPNSDQHSGRYSCGVYNNQSSNIVYTNTTVIIEIADIRNLKIGMIEPHSVNKSYFSSVIQLPNLPNLKSISHLFVVVTTNNETTPSQIPDSDLVSYGDPGSSGAFTSNGGIVGDKSSIMYVAAVVYNMNGDLGEKMLILGDESISRVGDKEYYNAPLDRQLTYYTFVRAYADNHNDSNPRYTSSGLSEPIALPVSSSDAGGSSGGGGAAIIGVVVVLIIIIIAIIIVIIVLLWYRKKYNKKQAPMLATVNPTKEDIALQEKSSDKAMLGPVETKSLPVVNIKEQEVKTSVGQPTTLYIEARGNPPPEISWTKNGLPVNDPLLQNGSLYIHSTTHSDQGTYTVTATSDEGSTSETIKLLVLNPQYAPSNRYKPVKVENFAEHLAMLHSSMNQQFTTDYDSLVVQSDFTFNGAKLEINVMKNRYKNILPYDHARVPLTLQDKIAGTDYINASFIDGYNERKAYIACQGPMASTTAEFWRMIWEQNVTAIVMVTNLTEEGKPKCQQYWPNDVNKSCTYGNISVTLIQEEVLAEYTIKTLAVKMIEASSEAKSVNLEVQHFHFTVWPDHGVPKYPTALLSFQKRVNKHHKRKRGSPLVVHCSAGVGRTGTFITIDMELQRIKHEAIVDVYNTVHKLRFRRNFTVQTLAQYVFVFDALMESIMCGDNSIAAPAKSAKLRLEELAKVNPATKLSGYESQFRKLQAASPKESDFQYICANLPENRHKNRSIKNLAPDNSRVYVTTSGYASDYICASYIDGYRHRKAFLATEGPMNSTAIDFWGMIWDRSSHAIVMLSLLEENGKETSVKYWPNKGETLQFGPFIVETTNESKSDKYFVRRVMQVKNTSIKESTPRTINQFQYLCWPDHSCPSEASSIMDMVEIVETVQRKSKNGPITVHCSDGLGRTGAFCALMQCHDRFKTEHMADVFYAIKTMRAQRPGMVENTAQYEFIHKTLKETMDRLETYSNF